MGNTHPSSLSHDTLAAQAHPGQAALKQGHPKSPDLGRDSSFQLPLRLGNSELSPPYTGPSDRTHTTRWQDTQPNLYWGGEGEEENGVFYFFS